MSREKGRKKQDGNTWLVLVGSWPHAALPKLNINFTGCAIDNFLTANDGSVNCWKQVPDDVKEPQEGKLFCMKVFDRMERHYCTAYMRAGDVDLAKLEADYRYY